MSKEQFDVVVVGHVDHGKSTLIGRLLADTGTLPDGKLEAVRAMCEKNARPFEYAFLLDALKNEQSQGITIDTARSFFKSEKRNYIIIDAPGHIEFLKNMITGAARAEGAILVIDAKEGVQENSRRHGYMLSLLGIRQVVVCVNKMDLVDYNQEVFRRIEKEYREFLAQIHVEPRAFLPISAFHGENMVSPSKKLPWYQGGSLLQELDLFEKEPPLVAQNFRFPVQDVYKFTAEGDDRRIIAGRVESGSLKVGDNVVFYPSQKECRITSIEVFNRPPLSEVHAGMVPGLTMEPEIYIKPGEVMAKKGEEPLLVGQTLRVNLFWLGRNPLVMGKKYKLKIATSEVSVWLRKVHNVLDASNLQSVANKNQLDLHDVGEIELETYHPIAFDPVERTAALARFVIVDDYEIRGGGIILSTPQGEMSLLEKHIEIREKTWERSAISPGKRLGQYKQKPYFILITGSRERELNALGKALEEKLFDQGRFVYFLGFSNSLQSLHFEFGGRQDRQDLIQRLGETGFLFTDAGALLITTIPDLEDQELDNLKTLVSPNQVYTLGVGETRLSAENLQLVLDQDQERGELVKHISRYLHEQSLFLDYYL